MLCEKTETEYKIGNKGRSIGDPDTEINRQELQKEL